MNKLATMPRYKWPKLTGCVARHVGSTQLAERYLLLAQAGAQPYKQIIAEAVSRRHRGENNGSVSRLHSAR